MLPRSGLASKHGLTLANAPGLIDAGYRGELICSVVNLDRDESVKIARGDRIAQLVIVAVPELRPAWVDELPPSEPRGGWVRIDRDAVRTVEAPRPGRLDSKLHADVAQR